MEPQVREDVHISPGDSLSDSDACDAYVLIAGFTQTKIPAR